MSQGNWGGGPPGGGWGGGGLPGGGGYGPPPGGGAPPGGYGPPPGGGAPPGGYGPPPGGGYGPPPGGSPYGPPPDAPNPYAAPAPGAMPGALGLRVRFTGEGSQLLVTFLLYYFLPIVAGVGAMFVFSMVGGAMAAVSTHGHRHGGGDGAGAIAVVFILLGVLVMFAAIAFGFLMFLHKLFAWRMENLIIDGQTCRYTGTAGGLVGLHLVTMLLCLVTLGFYTPWAIARYVRFMYENTEVNGQRGRLTFAGDGGSFFVSWLLGHILTQLTCYIYGAWYLNDVFAFIWENTRLDGTKTFSFRKDGGGFLGTWLLTVVLTYFTSGIYFPWGACQIIRWETERVV